MEPLSPEEERQRGLTRERLVGAALELVNEGGLDALSMRALADRLDVKAASLYWHVRDRRELPASSSAARRSPP
jgi:AcrR family transcriptional regulator